MSGLLLQGFFTLCPCVLSVGLCLPVLSSQAPRPVGNFFCCLPARIAELFSLYGMALNGMWVLRGRKANKAQGTQGMLAAQQEKNHL